MRWQLRAGGPLRWVKLLLSLWSREYHESRIILEQQGNLKYLVIPARLQRNFVRGILVALGGVTALVIGSTATAAWLQARKSMLEHSHREIFAALWSAGISPVHPGLDYSQEDMVEMARIIRERDMQIRQYVGDWTETLASRNQALRSMLDASGLNGKVISLIQRSQPMGGVSEDFGRNSLLSGAFAQETVANKELRSVLEALPNRMPLGEYSITSEFGIRRHPITNRPSLHAGIDLKPMNGDDTVRSVKRGKVLVAGHQGNLGLSVLIRHDHGVETLYGHLDRVFVKEGDEVEGGTPIGLVGNSGQSTGKHLHLEVLIGGFQVDPRKVIQTAQYVQQNQN